MTEITIVGTPVPPAAGTSLPALIVRAGPRAAERTIEFFTAEIPCGLEREDALQRKLSTHLLFVEFCQFTKVYPALSDAEFSIEVVCSGALTDDMKLIKGDAPPYLREEQRHADPSQAFSTKVLALVHETWPKLPQALLCLLRTA